MEPDRVLRLLLPDDPPPHLVWAAEELLARIGRPWRAGGGAASDVADNAAGDAAADSITLALNTALPAATPGLSVSVDGQPDSLQLARQLAADRPEDLATQQQAGRYHLAADVAASYLDWLGRREEAGNPSPDSHGRIQRENTALAAAPTMI